MYKANVHKISILSFFNTIVFATGKDHFQFIQQTSFEKLGKNLSFVIGFEEPEPMLFDFDTLAYLTVIPVVETGSELIGSVAINFPMDEMGQASYSFRIFTC